MNNVCINCKHWQLTESLEGEICRIRNVHTNPTDTCPQFSPKSTFDDLQNPYKYVDDKNIRF